MRIFVKLSVCVLIVSCTNSSGSRITIPNFPSNFYEQSFKRIATELRRDPQNIELAKQKMVYCQELNWPESCIDALEALRYNTGMSTNLIHQYLNYYSINNKNELLVSTIYKWDEIFKIKKTYYEDFINSLIKLNRYDSLLNEMPRYLKYNQTPESYLAAAKTYLVNSDSLLAIYYYSKVRNINGTYNEIGYEYPDLLFSLNFNERALDVMRSFSENHPDDLPYALHLSVQYELLDYLEESRNCLYPFAAQNDSVAYRIADLFKKMFLWDSAVMYLDTVLFKSPGNRKAMWKKARYYEDRGWLSYSIGILDDLILRDSLDTIAIKRKELINRKIAYLQRKKFEENKVPVMELKPKKINQ